MLGESGAKIGSTKILGDFFINYNSADERWAEWIAWQLEEDGYSVIVEDHDPRDDLGHKKSKVSGLFSSETEEITKNKGFWWPSRISGSTAFRFSGPQSRPRSDHAGAIGAERPQDSSFFATDILSIGGGDAGENTSR